MTSTDTDQTAVLPQLTLILAAPRGFCAGVDRAIQIVDIALEKYGKPVYVRHEIVHNKYVVDCLKQKGAIFVEELDEIKDSFAPVIFSAHGVPKSVPQDADSRKMFYLDATCPLVSKVHREAERHHKNGAEIILIGHAGHPEVIGTMGQLPDTQIHLVETLKDAQHITPVSTDNLAYITQTTLSVDDTKEIIETLQARFPALKGPNKEDICYATTNRQMAAKEIASQCDALIVVGAPNSSNSKRLVEVAARSGCPKSFLIERASDIDWDDFQNIKTLGLTAGASAPQILVDEMISAFQNRFTVTVRTVTTATEDISFKLPPALRKEDH